MGWGEYLMSNITVATNLRVGRVSNISGGVYREWREYLISNFSVFREETSLGAMGREGRVSMATSLRTSWKMATFNTQVCVCRGGRVCGLVGGDVGVV